MTWLLQLIWPSLQPETPEVRDERHKSNRDDLQLIRSIDWSKQNDLALEEAKYLAESEARRGRVADEKASTYLLVTAALIPLLTYLESAVWDQKGGTAPRWLSLPLLAAAVSYVIGTGFWAFRTLRVSSFVTMDAVDLAKIWTGKSEIKTALAAEYFVVARRNRDGINDKVGTILLAHKFLIRAFIFFCVLILVESGWELVVSLRAVSHPSVSL